MRYMLLIYSREDESSVDPESMRQIAERHRALMQETSQRGVFRAADPLSSSSTATTVRVENGNVLLTDGPYAETKEQLAGYYILDCENLDEAIAWAAKVPTSCFGLHGCVEIRPIRNV